MDHDLWLPFGYGRSCPSCLRTPSSLSWFPEKKVTCTASTRPLNLDCPLKSCFLCISFLGFALVSYHRLITQLFYLRSSKWFLCCSVSTYPFGSISPWNPCSLNEIWLLPSCCWSLLAPPHICNCLRWWFSFPAGHILSLASASDFSGSAAGQGEPNVLSHSVTIRISWKHRTFLNERIG